MSQSYNYVTRHIPLPPKELSCVSHERYDDVRRTGSEAAVE